MKRKEIILVLAVITGSLFGQPPELEQTLEKLRNTATEIEQKAERLRSTQPDFADWVRLQRTIYQNLEKSIRYDHTHAPERAASMLADYNFLLKRMREETEYFRTQKNPADSGSLNVLDFGAKGDGVTDDAPAFRKAFAAASTGPKRQVKIPSGTYLLKAEKGPVFLLEKIQDVEITGEKGSILLQESPRPTLFEIRDSDNVRLRNFHITAKKRPFTTGILKDIKNPDRLIVEIDPGMDSPLDPIYAECQSKGLMRFASETLSADGKSPEAHSIAPHVLSPKVEHIKERLYSFRVPKSGKVENIYRPGMRMIYYARDYGKQKIIGLRSKHLRLSGISMDTSSSMAFLFNQSESYFITGCTVAAKADTCMATCADGLYFYNGMLGGYIAGNKICDLGDDYINIHTQIRPVLRQEGNVIYTSSDLASGLEKEMSRIALIRRSKGENYPDREYMIRNIKRTIREEKNGKKIYWYRIEVAEEIPDLISVENQKKNKSARFDFLAFPELQNHGMVINGNIFARGVSRILPGGRNLLLSDNQFHDSLGWILFVLLENAIGHWDEVFLPRNVTFQHNTFHSLQKSVFQFSGRNYSSDMTKNKAHFYLYGNTFQIKKWNNRKLPLFKIYGTDHIEFKQNRIHTQERTGEVFEIRNSRGIRK